ncbi:MAG: YdcF family protein [Lachnospiraceae bacterium]|nr:YdcF family protein [Lachnospiraceae bacterium]
MIYRSLAFLGLAMFLAGYVANALYLRNLNKEKGSEERGKTTNSKIIMSVITITLLLDTIAVVMGKSYLPIMAKAGGFYLTFLSGIISVWAYADRREKSKDHDSRFKKIGVYRYSRNPLYLALDLLIIGLTLMYCQFYTIISAAAAVIFFHICIVVKEKEISKKHPEEFAKYKEDVSAYYGFGKISFKKCVSAAYLLLIIWCVLYLATLLVYAGPFLSWNWIWIFIGIFALIRYIMLRRDILGLRKHKIPMAIRIIYYSVFGIGLAIFTYVEANICAAMNTVPEDDLEYVIVLGAGLKGTTPTAPLVKRIEEGFRYMSENPDTILVASGGQGFNESISEAECIKRELVRMGIDENRIVLEDRSVSTIQNLEFSLEIIGNPDASVGIITNSFHEYRAMQIAKRAGYTNAHYVPAETLFPVGIHYMLREFFGVVRFWMDPLI